MNRWLTRIVTVLIMSVVAVSVSAQTSETWTQSGLDLAMGEMNNTVANETGLHLAPTGEIRSYEQPEYTVDVRETAAVYTSTIADMGAEVVWMNAEFTHSGSYYDNMGDYSVMFEVRAGYTDTPGASWSGWIDLMPPVETSTCVVVDNPFQARLIDGAMVDLTIPGGRMTCFAATNLGGITLPQTQYLQYRITMTTDSDETNVTVNDIIFTYEPANIQSQDTDPSAVTTSSIYAYTLSLSLTLLLTLTLTGLTYGTYLDVRIRR